MQLVLSGLVLNCIELYKFNEYIQIHKLNPNLIQFIFDGNVKDK